MEDIEVVRQIAASIVAAPQTSSRFRKEAAYYLFLSKTR
jgi:hypothetical protein